MMPLRVLAATGLLVTSVAHGNLIGTMTQSMTTQQMVESGREAFLNRCSGCHGVTGEGNGPASSMLNPRPRNLVNGSFKLRSTPMGTLPTVADLLRTINQGIPGSSMPSFKELSDPEKLAIVLYVRSLRPEFKETLAAQKSISLPPPPAEIFTAKAGLMAAAKRGRAVYEKSCLSCHGQEGLGDGVSAEGMTDSEDRPIKPANLSSNRLKSGVSALDVFKAISTGLDGAPMPAYADSISEKDRWDLVAYIFYLRGRAAQIYTAEDQLK